jgi:hypothetical protein
MDLPSCCMRAGAGVRPSCCAACWVPLGGSGLFHGSLTCTLLLAASGQAPLALSPNRLRRLQLPSASVGSSSVSVCVSRRRVLPSAAAEAVSDAVRDVYGDEKTVGPCSSADSPAAPRHGSSRSHGVRFSVHTASRGRVPNVQSYLQDNDRRLTADLHVLFRS